MADSIHIKRDGTQRAAPNRVATLRVSPIDRIPEEYRAPTTNCITTLDTILTDKNTIRLSAEGIGQLPKKEQDEVLRAYVGAMIRLNQSKLVADIFDRTCTLENPIQRRIELLDVAFKSTLLALERRGFGRSQQTAPNSTEDLRILGPKTINQLQAHNRDIQIA